MLPQRGIPFRPPVGARPLVGMPLRTPSGSPSRFGSPFARPGMPSRVSPLKAKVPIKPPSSLFGEKKYWSKVDMRQSIKKLSPFILKGKVFTQQQRERMVEQWFPYQKYGAYVTEQETKQALRQMRRKGFWAKSSKEKKSIKTSAKLLEAFTRVRKY